MNLGDHAGRPFRVRCRDTMGQRWYCGNGSWTFAPELAWTYQRQAEAEEVAHMERPPIRDDMRFIAVVDRHGEAVFQPERSGW